MSRGSDKRKTNVKTFGEVRYLCNWMVLLVYHSAFGFRNVRMELIYMVTSVEKSGDI